MGSSTSKPREGHEHPDHLPKVGTPADLEWRHRTRINQVFGSTSWRIAAVVAVVLAVIGLVLLFI